MGDTCDQAKYPKSCNSKTYCVGEEWNCPITDIQLLTNPAEDDGDLVVPLGYVAVKFSSSKTLVYQQSKIKSSVFGFFDIAEGGTSCTNKSVQDEKDDQYLLLRHSHNGCGTYGKDANAFKVD